MLNWTAIIITLISGFTVSILGGIIVQHYKKRFIDANPDSPLPFIKGMKAQGMYKYLEGDWNEYHVTKDIYLEKEPYWLRDRWHIEVRDGFRIKGLLQSPSSEDNRDYPLVGEIRQGRLIITGSSMQTPQDYFTVIFPEITVEGRDEPIVGTMMAFDYQDMFYVSPTILSRDPLSLERLNEIVKILLDSPNKPINHYRVSGSVKILRPHENDKEKI
jgi:hypothetical protein